MRRRGEEENDERQGRGLDQFSNFKLPRTMSVFHPRNSNHHTTTHHPSSPTINPSRLSSTTGIL